MSAPNTPAGAPGKSTPSFANLSDMFNQTFDAKPGGLWEKMRRGTASTQEREEFSRMVSELHGTFEAITALPISPDESTGGKAKREMLEAVGARSWSEMARAAALETGHDDKHMQKLTDGVGMMRRTLALLAYTESLESTLREVSGRVDSTNEKLRKATAVLEELTAARTTAALHGDTAMSDWEMVGTPDK